MRIIKVLATALPLLLTGCLFDFERGIELQPGDVGGRALRGTDEPAPYAKVLVDGTGARRLTNGSGDVLVRDLPAGGWRLLVRDDKNGDGWDERFAQRAFAINVVSHADGLFGQSEAKRTWVLLGDILLDGVVEVRGRVERAGAGVPGAIVVAFRQVELPATTLDGAVERASITVDGEVEAATATDDDGAFYFPAIGAGSVTYAAFFNDGTDALASVPVTIEAGEGEDVAANALTLAVVEPPATRAVQIELDRAPEGSLDVTLVRAGVPRDAATGGDLVELGLQQVTLSVPLEVPHGVWDVYLDDTGSDARGIAYQQAATVAGDDLSTWGIVLLSERDRCAGEDANGDAIRDCDGDGVAGLPPYDDPGDAAYATWLDCVSACEDAHGSDNGGATCNAGGSEWDCDDDGDGQADVTEPGCYGLALGPDRDGDRLCDPVNPFPQCAENDAAHPACGADRDPADWRPPVAPFDEVTPDAGPRPDAGFDDGGVTDGGPTDGGGPDGGPVPSDAGADAGPDTDSGVIGFVRSFDPGRFGRWDFIEGGATWGALGFYGLPVPFTLYGCPTQAPAGDSVFVASFDDEGQCQTAVAIPMLLDDLGDLIALPDGGFVLVGFATDPLTFPGGPNGQPASLDPGAAFSMGFVARYAADGSLVHLRRLLSEPAGETTGIFDVVRAPGGYYVAGSFRGPAASLEGEPPANDAGPSNDGALDLVNSNTGNNTGFVAFLDDTGTPSTTLSAVLTSSGSAQAYTLAYLGGTPGRLYVSGSFSTDVDGVTSVVAGGGQFLLTYDVTTAFSRTSAFYALGGNSVFTGLAAGDGVAYWGVRGLATPRDLYDEAGTLHVATAASVGPLYRVPDDTGQDPTLFASLTGVAGEQAGIDAVAVQDSAVFFAGHADSTVNDDVVLDYGTTVTFQGGSQFQANPAGFIARADDVSGVADAQWHLLTIGSNAAQPIGLQVRGDGSVDAHILSRGDATIGTHPTMSYGFNAGLLVGIDADGRSGE